MLEPLVRELGTEISSIELLKWFREKSDRFRCLSCGVTFKDTVWYIDTKPGDDIKIKEKGNQAVEIVCCSCGRRNPLSELIKQL